jgi:dienelactone hydrolase
LAQRTNIEHGEVDGMVDLAKLKSPVEWAAMRADIEAEVLSVVGPINRDQIDLQLKTVDEVEFRGYVRRRINYFVDAWDRISAWLFVPEGKDEAPGILCCHQQVGQGKDEPAGLEGDPRMATAVHYAERGYVTLAPDCITAGDRVSSRLKPYDTRMFYKDNPKLSLAAKMLMDHMRAVDVFAEVKRVDSARIGVSGHGLGGFNAMMLAAFDDRVQACVSSCGFTRLSTEKDLDRWCGEEGLCLLPRLKECVKEGKLGFDFEHILAMAAPSPTLVITSLAEAEFANPRSCQKAVTLAAKVYKLLGAANAIDHYGHHDGHRVTPETLEVADEWFERWL